MTMHNNLHLTVRLYEPRKEEGRELGKIEDNADASIRQLEVHRKKK